MSQSRPEDPRTIHSRQTICRAALLEFATEGYAGFRMESVAARAGVGRSTVYRHWSNKAALIGDALQTLNRQPDPRRELAIGTACEQARVILMHLAEVLGPGSVFSDCVPAMIHAAETDSEIRDFHHAYAAQRRQRLTDVIAQGVAAGEIGLHIDPDAASAALAGAMFYRRLMTSDAPDAHFVDMLVDTVLRS